MNDDARLLKWHGRVQQICHARRFLTCPRSPLATMATGHLETTWQWHVCCFFFRGCPIGQHSHESSGTISPVSRRLFSRQSLLLPTSFLQVTANWSGHLSHEKLVPNNRLLKYIYNTLLQHSDTSAHSHPSVVIFSGLCSESQIRGIQA